MYEPIKIKRSQKFGLNYWHGNSLKLNREVTFFGDLSYEHYLQVECDSTIETFCERPLEIAYSIDGMLKYCTPDMWVKYKDGKEEFRTLIYGSFIDKNGNKKIETSHLLNAQQKWCDDKGFHFSIYTEKTLRENLIWVDNCRILLSFLRYFNPDYHKSVLNEIISLLSKEKSSLEMIQNTLYMHSSQDSQIAVFYGLFTGILNASLKQQPIKQSMEVWLNE